MEAALQKCPAFAKCGGGEAPLASTKEEAHQIIKEANIGAAGEGAAGNVEVITCPQCQKVLHPVLDRSAMHCSQKCAEEAAGDYQSLFGKVVSNHDKFARKFDAAKKEDGEARGEERQHQLAKDHLTKKEEEARRTKRWIAAARPQPEPRGCG